mmetsp:Transcript_34615/g.89769  ORF Transcript_34615/g.89769 Transcript_34615/m.89769 type:complete len:171 (-) Transcript_34615:88-600(-)
MEEEKRRYEVRVQVGVRGSKKKRKEARKVTAKPVIEVEVVKKWRGGTREATAERETAITDRMARAGEKEAETEMGATGEEKAVGEMIVEEKTGGETTAREVREIETGMAMTEIGETDIEVEGMKRTDTEEMREEGANETTTGEREEVTDGNSEMTREVGEGRDDRGGTKK